MIVQQGPCRGACVIVVFVDLIVFCCLSLSVRRLKGGEGVRKSWSCCTEEVFSYAADEHYELIASFEMVAAEGRLSCCAAKLHC